MEQNLENSSKTAAKSQKAPVNQLATKGETIILAIDSSKKDESQIKKNLSVLKAFGYREMDIIPVTVFTPLDLGWLMPLDNKKKKIILANVKKEILQRWQEIELNSKKAKCFVSPTNSIRASAAKLIRFATQKSAKAIIVGSGAKSRSSLTGLGSFSETLISLSPIPVIVVGESVEVMRPISKILYPTDFSEASYAAFKKAVLMAKKSNAELILYHYLDLNSGPLAYGIPWIYEVKWLDDYWTIQEEIQAKSGKSWSEWAIRHGVKCHFLCDRKIGGLQHRLIEAVKEQNIDLVAVSIQRGPWSQVILGGNVRSLFAHSICPVMAIHSKIKNKILHS